MLLLFLAVGLVFLGLAIWAFKQQEYAQASGGTGLSPLAVAVINYRGRMLLTCPSYMHF